MKKRTVFWVFVFFCIFLLSFTRGVSHEPALAYGEPKSLTQPNLSVQRTVTEEQAQLALAQGRILADPNRLSGGQPAGAQFPRLVDSIQQTGRITYESTRSGIYDLYVQDADGGSQAQPVILSPWTDVTPAISPDGTQIVFASDRQGNYDIYLLNSEGQVINLTYNLADDIHPAWSPAGDRIIFSSLRGGAYYQIYTMNPDGSNVQQVGTIASNAMYPHISPNGSQVSYMRASVTVPVCQWNWDVWVMDADGTDQRQVTSHLAGDLYPNWTPDGRIIYGGCHNYLDADLYVINPNTGVETQLNSWFWSNEWGGVYSPDGADLAFNSDRDNDVEIYIASLENGIANNLTQNSADDLAASWHPAPDIPPYDTYKISGRAMDVTGNPIPDVSVSASTIFSDLTDEHGYYLIDGLPAGSYTLMAFKSGYTFPSLPLEVSVPPDRNLINFVGLDVDCTGATASQPIMLIPGFGGSEDRELTNDDQMVYIYDLSLKNHGYVYGCNLFYAKNTSAQKSQAENAKVIRDNLCDAYPIVKALQPGWNGHYDIIGHSYGGLRGRAYLEDSKDYYHQACPSTTNTVTVDHLITLGTPHGGVIGDLPFDVIIGFPGIFKGEWIALWELLPPVRLWQNLTSHQPPGVSYHSISGDARQQYPSFPPVLRFLYDLFRFGTEDELANDLAIHRWSAWILQSYPWLYPNLYQIGTPDLHGHAPYDSVGYHTLRSYMNPNTTFEEEICPILGIADCQSDGARAITKNSPSETSSVLDMVRQQSSPKSYAGGGMMDIQAGSIGSGGVVTGQFDLYGNETSMISLAWLEGDITLELVDPNGSVITPQTVITDTNIDFLSLDTGYGWLAAYQITDTITGTWGYTLTAQDIPQDTLYRLFAMDTVPVSVNASMPEWMPNNHSVVITASLTLSGSELASVASVLARIQLPDASYVDSPLFDDGAHGDGLPGDGIFGEAFSQTSQGGLYGVQIIATGTIGDQDFRRTNTAFFFIAPDTAILDDVYDDAGIDQNQDGFFEWLGVSTGITVTQPGTYTLSAELYAGTEFISMASVQIHMDPGHDSMTLLFDGDDILAHELDGPYTVRNVMLFDTSGGMLLIQGDDFVHITAAYAYTEFRRTGYTFLPIIRR